MATEYVKKIKFQAVPDSKTFNDLKKTMKDIGFSFGESITKELREVEQLQHQLKSLQEQFKSIEHLKGAEFDKLRDELKKQIDDRKKKLSDKGIESDEEKKQREAQEELTDLAIDKLEDWSKKALNALAGIFKDAWAELANITNFSRLSNADTRNLAFTYGFNSSQAYGYSQAMGMMGFASEEDLMYATADEIAEFKSLFSKYTEWYEGQGKEELQLYRDFEIELKEFKQDMKLTVVDFFMDNKDDIKAFIEFSFELGKFLMNSLGWLVRHFGGGVSRSNSDRASAVSDAFGGSVNNSKVTTNNFNNTFSVSSSDAKTVYKNVLQTQLALS